MKKLAIMGFLFLLGVAPALLAQDSRPDPLAEYKSLSDAYRQASLEFSKATRAVPPADQANLYNNRDKNPVYKYIPLYAALADKAKGTEVNFRAWQFVFNNRMRYTGDEAESWEKKSLLAIREHSDQDYYAEFVGRIYGSGLNAKTTAAIVEAAEVSKNVAVRTASLFLKGTRLYGGAASTPSPEDRALGRTILEGILKDPAMANVKISNTTYGKRIEGMFFKEDHLSIGKVAPDFETTDQDGKSWKLSDYRGNVVVVDFWGFW